MLWTATTPHPTISPTAFARFRRPTYATVHRTVLLGFCNQHAIPLPRAVDVTQDAFVDHVHTYLPSYSDSAARHRFRFEQRRVNDARDLWVVDPVHAAKLYAAAGYPGAGKSAPVTLSEMNDVLRERHESLIRDIKDTMKEINTKHITPGTVVKKGSLVDFADPKIRPEWDAPAPSWRGAVPFADVVDDIAHLRTIRRTPVPKPPLTPDEAMYLVDYRVREYVRGGNDRRDRLFVLGPAMAAYFVQVKFDGNDGGATMVHPPDVQNDDPQFKPLFVAAALPETPRHRQRP